MRYHDNRSQAPVESDNFTMVWSHRVKLLTNITADSLILYSVCTVWFFAYYSDLRHLNWVREIVPYNWLRHWYPHCEILNPSLYFTANLLHNIARILKIGQYLLKISTKVWCLHFAVYNVDYEIAHGRPSVETDLRRCLGFTPHPLIFHFRVKKWKNY